MVAEIGIVFHVAVLFVAQNRMPDVRQVFADLLAAAGLGRHVEEAVSSAGVSFSDGMREVGLAQVAVCGHGCLEPCVGFQVLQR